MQKLGRKEGVSGVVAWRRRWWWWRAWGCWPNEHFLLCLSLVFFIVLWLSVRRPPCVPLFSPSLFCLSFVVFMVSLCLSFSFFHCFFRVLFLPPLFLCIYRERPWLSLRHDYSLDKHGWEVLVFCWDLDTWGSILISWG